MSFGEAIKSVFSKYTTFSGRARRSEFWWYYLFATLVQLPFVILFYVLFFAAFAPVWSQANPDGSIPDDAIADLNWGLIVLGGALLFVVWLVLFIPSLAVWARRLHDMGQSGHWLWLMLISLGIVPLIMTVMDSEARANRWGEDPKAGERQPLAGPGYGYGNPPAPPQ